MRTNAIDLGAAPPIGHVLQWAGMTYTVTKAHSLTLRDGTLYAEIYWEHACPDCGVTVVNKTGLKCSKLPWRCKACNGPEDKDRLERAAYVKRKQTESWVERQANAKKSSGGLGCIRVEPDYHMTAADSEYYGDLAVQLSFTDGTTWAFTVTDKEIWRDKAIDEPGDLYALAAKSWHERLYALRTHEIDREALFS